MLILIHGNDNAKSRMKLRQILETSKEEKIYLDGRKISFNELLLVVVAFCFAAAPLASLSATFPNTSPTTPVAIFLPLMTYQRVCTLHLTQCLTIFQSFSSLLGYYENEQ